MKLFFPFPYFICLVILISTTNNLLLAQEKHPITVSIGTQSMTVPWNLGQVTERFNPVLIAGTEGNLKKGHHFNLYYTQNVGYFYNYWWMNALFFDTEIGAGYNLPYGFHSDLRLGIGYLHYFWRREQLELKDGEYVKVTNWGEPSLLIPLSLVIGYRGNPEKQLIAEPFITMQWAVQGLFVEEAPVLPHLMILIGSRIPLTSSVISGKGGSR